MPAESSRSALHLFKTWFWSPPRPHGDTIIDRRVSPLELLYDLVYAAVIAQAGLHLAQHLTGRGLLDFAIVFSLTWIAWSNGSLYLELHGRSNGRTRTYVFLQIGILTLLAVFTTDAGEGSGPGFALTYAAFLALMTWLWYDVRRQDVVAGRPEFVTEAGRYVVAMSVSVPVVLVSAVLPAEARLAAWALVIAVWIVLLEVMGRTGANFDRALTPTDSLVERVDTFTLIVLGEVVFGVVDGLSQSSHDLKTISTGMIALVVGFGFWWIYFDVVGGKPPKREGGPLTDWLVSHYPITISIAAAGSGMVSLVANAHAGRTPAATSWLLSGAVAIGLLALIPTCRALQDSKRLAGAYRPLEWAMAAGAVVSLVIGWIAPAPWLLALLLVAVLGLVWAIGVRGFVLAGAWEIEKIR